MGDCKEPAVKTFSFGGCDIAETSPVISKVGPLTQVLNVHVEFEDALKLHLAIGECIRKLNSYKRSTTAESKLHSTSLSTSGRIGLL